MTAETLTLSLTGPGSHRLRRDPGMGSLIIGPADGQRRADLVVTPDQAIDWHVFDDMRTGAGSNWPRYIQYEGHDRSLFAWMRERETEEVTFVARADVDIDARDAQLGGLTLWPGAHRIAIALPPGLGRLSIMGHPAGMVFDIDEGDPWPDISLVAPEKGVLTSVAGLDHLRGVHSLSISNAVLDAPFDCRSLLPLSHLRHVRLRGAMANLDALAELRLGGLELRFVPNLDGLPALSAWPELSYFIAWNVDEIVGKNLRQAVKGLPADEDHFFSVSQLRKRPWFVEKYGLPFGGWTSKNEKAASKAYKAAGKALAAATTGDGAKAAIIAFVETINLLPGIETSERDDAGDAVALLAAIRPDLVPVDDALGWFDETRDF